MKVIVVPGMPRIAGRRYHIAKALAGQGHEVHYLLWDLPYNMTFRQLINHIITSLGTKEYMHEGIKMHKFRRLPLFWPYVNGLFFKKQLKNLSKKIEPDFIFSQSYTNETEVPEGLPLIYDLNDDNVAMAEVYGSFIYKAAFRLLQVRTVIKRQCENALAITAVSEATYRIGKKYNKNVFKLPNGVDTEIIKRVKKDKSTYPKNDFSIIYVTGFNQWSRPIETMQVIMKLKKEFPLIDLTLIGEGTEAQKIKKFIKANQLGGYVHYLGGIYDRKILFEHIKQSAICLNISEINEYRNAAQPIKIFEYSALGKKIVSSGLNEVKRLNFPNVFIFSETNKSFMNTLVRTIQDNGSYDKIGRYIINEYDWNKITKELIKLKKTIHETSKA